MFAEYSFADLCFHAVVDNPCMDSIGKRVKALRKSAGLTQAQLADLVGITQPSLSSIESDQSTKIRAATMNGLADALRTTTQYILFGREDGRSLENEIEQAELAHIYEDLPPDRRAQLLGFARGLHLGSKSNNPIVRAVREKSKT